MNIEEALNTAIEYEERVRETYAEALAEAEDAAGKRIFKLLADEEDDHVRYLKAKLNTYNRDKTLSSEDLGTALPPVEKIQKAIEKLQDKVVFVDFKNELDLLKKAREMELETSAFYKKMVDELPDQGKAFFKRFVEIEEGHVLLVEAEMDYLQHKGAWLAVDDGEFKFF